MAGTEKTRYSDAELAEFKQIILEKLEKARADYDLLRATITHTSSNGTDDTSPTFKIIQNLEAALVRIENKTYGICRETGKLIPKERLRVVPHATLSIEAKESGVK